MAFPAASPSPFPLPLPPSRTTAEVVAGAIATATAAGEVAPGDTVVVLAGSPDAPTPVTDLLRVVVVP